MSYETQEAIITKGLFKLISHEKNRKLSYENFKEILKNNPKLLTEKDSESNSLLLKAIKCNNKPIIKFLLSCHNVHEIINQTDKEGKSPLFLTIFEPFKDKKRSSFMNDELVLQLIKKGADINRLSLGNSSLLHYAVQNFYSDTVNFLLKKEAQVNLIDSNGKTPLHYIVEAFIYKKHKNNVSYTQAFKILSALMIHKANPNQADFNGNTPLHYAMLNGKKSVISLLVTNDANLSKLNHLNQNPLNQVDQDGNTPLHLAVKNKKVSLIKYMIEKSASINVENNKKETPLSMAENLSHSKFNYKDNRQKPKAQIISLFTEINSFEENFKNALLAYIISECHRLDKSRNTFNSNPNTKKQNFVSLHTMLNHKFKAEDLINVYNEAEKIAKIRRGWGFFATTSTKNFKNTSLEEMKNSYLKNLNKKIN